MTLDQQDGPLAAKAADSFSHGVMEVNGVRLHYVLEGAGPAVVLLHGWPTSWYEWRRTIPVLAEAGYTVVAPDLRGLGESEKPPGGYDKATLAEDVYALCRALGIEQAAVVGHDWGTSTAFALAHLHPTFVERAVLSENIIPGLPAGDEDWDTLNAHFWHHALMNEPDLPELLITGRERPYLTWFYRKLTYNWSRFPNADVDEFVRTYTAPGSLRAGFEYYRAIPEDARRNRNFLAQGPLPMPVMVVTGDFINGGRLHRQVRPVAADYREAVIPRCGHFVPIERPDELSALLLGFLSATTAPPRNINEETA